MRVRHLALMRGGQAMALEKVMEGCVEYVS